MRRILEASLVENLIPNNKSILFSPTPQMPPFPLLCQRLCGFLGVLFSPSSYNSFFIPAFFFSLCPKSLVSEMYPCFLRCTPALHSFKALMAWTSKVTKPINQTEEESPADLFALFAWTTILPAFLASNPRRPKAGFHIIAQ